MITFEKVSKQINNDAYRIMWTGPGVLTGTIGTFPLEQCKKYAPEEARRIKNEEGRRYVSWKFIHRPS